MFLIWSLLRYFFKVFTKCILSLLQIYFAANIQIILRKYAVFIRFFYRIIMISTSCLPLAITDSGMFLLPISEHVTIKPR